ncbi:MAG: fluoride efflux transporter CrcB [Alphaproteobacteria bacterium]
MNHLLVVALGGAIGAAGRHLVGMSALRLFGPNFPWGTFTVNITGAFLMGVLIETLALKGSVSQEVRLFLATGVLGGFTTFSAFSLDVVLLFDRKGAGLAALYAGASVVLSLLALFAGLRLMRVVLG